MTPRTSATGIVCHHCHDVVVSRHQHDFRRCECKKVAIDGGRSYTRTLGNPDDYSFVRVTVMKQQMHRESRLAVGESGSSSSSS